MALQAALQAPGNPIDDLADEAERRLIDEARDDSGAFARLYRRHYACVAGYIHRRTGRRDLTEDLVSEVFLTALKKLPGYRHRGTPFRAWLYRIASNAVNQWARRERRRRRREQRHAPSAAVGTDSPVPDSRNTSRGDVVRRALLSLAPKHQDVLILHHLEGLDIEQIARVFGRPAGTIKSRLHRAREALRRALGERTTHD